MAGPARLLTTHRAPSGAISRLRHGIPALIVVLVALTAIGLGHARGLVLAGGQIVLCSGGQAVSVPVPGHEGQGRTALCPDMAIGLLVAVAAPPPDLAVPAGAWRPAPSSDPTVRPDHGPPVPKARGPPTSVSTA